MSCKSFLTKLDECVAKYDLLCHPFYQAWKAGKLTRDDLCMYAIDYYHHVAAFPQYLGKLAARLPEGATRNAILQNKAEEEGAKIPAGRSHSDLWLDFAESVGADRGQVSGSKPIKEIAELIAHFASVAKVGSVAEALATFYAYESQVPKVAKEKATGLKQWYGVEPKGCVYFTLHTVADVHHAKVWRDLIASEINRTRENTKTIQEAVLKAAERAAQSLWRALDGIESTRQLATVGK